MSMIALLAALPGFVVIIALGAWAFVYAASQPAGPGEIDAGGMVIVAIISVTSMYALAVLVAGFIAALLSLRFTQKKCRFAHGVGDCTQESAFNQSGRSLAERKGRLFPCEGRGLARLRRSLKDDAAPG